MGDHNCCYVVELKPGADTNEEDLHGLFKCALHHIASGVAETIEVDNICAVSTADEKNRA